MRKSRLLITALAFALIGAHHCIGQTNAPLEPALAQANDSSSSAAQWLSSKSANLSQQQVELLRRAQATLLGNVVSLLGWKPYRGVEPSLSTYQGIWNWDSAFHAIAISEWDPKLAREQFDILFDRQLPSGALPDVVWANGDTVATITKPPVMAWAVAVVDRRDPDAEFLRKIYPKLKRLGEFWLNERGGAADGLFFYAGSDAGEDSGWDDSIRWDGGYRNSADENHRLWAIDLNCYMVMHYRAMAYIAGRMGLARDQHDWLHAASALASRINAKLWDDTIGFYVDRDRVSGKNGPALSPAGFMPLFVGIANRRRASRVVKLAEDSDYFFPRMPTAAYNTQGFVSNGYWRGSTWLNTSYFALKGLMRYGYTCQAGVMRSQLLNDVAADPSTIWEYYDSRNGAGHGAKGFGWSAAFICAFILDWDNDNLTWLLPMPNSGGASRSK